jgi:hypothetical protein
MQNWQYNAGNGYITTEIVDVDNDGKNDIILTGDEGRPAPALYSPSTIFFNKNNNFQTQTQICIPNASGWGTVMDIACADVDGDGINEIFLDRTGDITGIWYGGYTINVYKSDKTNQSFSDVTNNYIKNNISIQKRTTAWMWRMLLYKSNNSWNITGYTTGQTIKNWIQDPSTKIFQ